MKKRKLFVLFSVIFVALVFWLYRPWFIHGEVIGGDWPYFSSDLLHGFTLVPTSWGTYQGNGLGGPVISYALDTYLYFIVTLFINFLHIPWVVIYKLFFFSAFIVLSVFSSMYLSQTVLIDVVNWQIFLSAFIYSANTYIFMVTGGGQMGVALAYALAPLVLAQFIRATDSLITKARNIFVLLSTTGLTLAVLIMFDVRVAYVVVISTFIYILMQFFLFDKTDYKKLFLISFPLVVALLLNFSWIIPMIVYRSTPLQALVTKYNSIDGFRFYSFAPFSQAFGLLHPNWPENIFGKVYFMRSQFLAMTILAFSGLLLIHKYRKQQVYLHILFFSLVALVGVFLSKGANSPFGEINVWMFTHVPGFVLFRDPTKFYILIALSYSMLIPFSLASFVRAIQEKNIFNRDVKKFIIKVLLGGSTLLLILLIAPALEGKLTSTFAPYEVPQEYNNLANFFHTQPNFFRTLWIPRQQRFTYYSNLHPSVEGMTLYHATASASIIQSLHAPQAQETLSRLSIKYVVVSYDVFGEIFSKDRLYDEQQYQEVIRELDDIKWLKKLSGFEKIILYEVPYMKDHFWLDEIGEISYRRHSAVRYTISVSISKPTDVIFSETYSPYWVATVDGETIVAKKTQENTNMFTIQKTGNRTIDVYFAQQYYYDLGWKISILVAIIICIYLLREVYVQRKKI